MSNCAAPAPSSPNCLSITGNAAALVDGTATYVANCVNTSAYIWRLNSVRILACDNLSACAITFPTVGNNVVNVAPTVGTSATIPVAVYAPTSCSAISGPIAVEASTTTTYAATCRITNTLVWKLNGVQIPSCNNLVGCAVTLTTLGANTLTVAPTATSAANATATLTVTAVAPAASCFELTGSNIAPAAASSQSYAAVCTNTSSYVWKLGGTTLGCTTATCAVNIPANASPTQVLRTLTVAPSTATASSAALIVAQAPAAVAPQCTGSVTGQTAYPFSGGTSGYSVSCTGASSTSWVLGGIAQSCAGTSCAVVVPANTVASVLNLSLAVTATNLNGSTNLPALAITVAAVPACSLDFNGDSIVNTTDALIFSRWLLGFRGDSLVAGITPYPVGTSMSAFASAVSSRIVISANHDFDQDTLVNTATDGLLFMRLTQGLKDTAVTNFALGQGAKRNTYDLIRLYMNSVCGTTYPQ